MNDIKPRLMTQTAPWPIALEEAVAELRYLPGWRFWLSDEQRGQDCVGLTLNIVPNHPDSYHPERHANTRFLYPVPAAAFNRESWEEWLWARIDETDDHERAEWFKFVDEDGNERRPFKPLHADGWDPGFVRKVVSEELSDVPNAGRFVFFPCIKCEHSHKGRMGEHFVIAADLGCQNAACACGKQVGARQPTEESGEAELWIDSLRFVVAPGEYTGLDIRHFAHPPIGADRDLFLWNPGDQMDRFIAAEDKVDVCNRQHFYTLPREENNGG